MADDTDGTILVTGASRGIGKAAALHLDGLGFRVLAGVRSEEDAAALRREGSERMEPVFLDVTDPESIAAAAETARRAAPGGLAGLVNNAGMVVAGPLELLPPEAIRSQLDVNSVGPVALTQAMLPLLRSGAEGGTRATPGRIVNVSSANGRVATPWAGAYAASKFALEALSDALRMELRPWGIPVVVVQPGAIDTPIWRRSFERAMENLGGVPPERKELYATTLEKLERRQGRGPSHAIPAERVARVIARALTARRPKTRYLVGREAWLAALVAPLPDRLRDRILGG
ncbi:MAG: SDR family oxidoreductase [Acidobacteriota bacterium]